MLIQIFDTPEIWVTPEMVTHIAFMSDEYAIIYTQGNDLGFRVTHERARALIALINKSAATNQRITHDQAPNPAPKIMQTKLLAMTRDLTSWNKSPYWRCATAEGFMVNVFKNDDPLKDTFQLLALAGYGDVMDGLEYGQTINWTQHPIEVQIVEEITVKGRFWKVTEVRQRATDAMHDTVESDDPDAA